MYLVTEGGRTILIDPCSTDKLPTNICVDIILATHEHYDHISGINFWKERTGARFICSETCDKNCQDPRKNLSRYFTAFCELQTWIRDYVAEEVEDYSCAADETYQDRSRMQWQGHEIELLECPGHSQGGQCIVVDGEVLFSGDSLINGYRTACNMPGGNRKQWINDSLPRIRALDGNMKVYPGHFEPFILSEYQDGENNH